MSKFDHIFLHHEFRTFMYVCTVYISTFVIITVFVYSMNVLSHMTLSLIIAFKLKFFSN